MTPSEVFLSHSSQDRRAAVRLAELLVRHGIPVFYAPRDIQNARQWHDEIGAALKRCDWFLVLLSPHSVQSKWVKHEMMYALRNDRYIDRIVPVLYQPCDVESLSWTLDAFQFVDLTRGFDAGCRDLVRTWGIGFRSK